jgi:hypothetical protein
VYLTGSGRPAQDACELDLVARAFGTGGARLTALTPLTGEHAGLGALRVAAAALEVSGARTFALSDVGEPIRPNLRFTTLEAERADRAPRTGLVHGLAQGGSHVALVMRTWSQEATAAA